MALAKTRRTLKNLATDVAIVAVPMNLGPDDDRTTSALRANDLPRTPPPAVAKAMPQSEPTQLRPAH